MHEAIRQFLKPPPEGAYTDQRLVDLLGHAETGKLSFRSCCCLVGASNATHLLTGADEYCRDGHYLNAIEALNNPDAVEDEFLEMGNGDRDPDVSPTYQAYSFNPRRTGKTEEVRDGLITSAFSEFRVLKDRNVDALLRTKRNHDL